MTAFRIPVALLCAAGLALFTPSPALAQKTSLAGDRPILTHSSISSAPFAQREAIRAIPSPQPALWDVAANGEFDTGHQSRPASRAREASATDVNDEGIVVLNTDQSGEAYYPAWVLVPGREFQSLPQIGNRAHASAINNLGEIVGSTGNGGASGDSTIKRGLDSRSY